MVEAAGVGLDTVFRNRPILAFSPRIAPAQHARSAEHAFHSPKSAPAHPPWHAPHFSAVRDSHAPNASELFDWKGRMPGAHQRPPCSPSARGVGLAKVEAIAPTQRASVLTTESADDMALAVGEAIHVPPVKA